MTTSIQRKQDAYQAQQRAREKRSPARDAMNLAKADKQSICADKSRSWQQYQSVRGVNVPRIDSLDALQGKRFKI